MANAVWPASLPQDAERPHKEKFQENTVRTPMDAGPDKVRRRYTAGVKAVQASMQMTKAQTITLETFFDDTLKGGSLPFDWLLPRTAATATFRFTAPPELTHIAGLNWDVQLQLEILP